MEIQKQNHNLLPMLLKIFVHLAFFIRLLLSGQDPQTELLGTTGAGYLVPTDQILHSVLTNNVNV